MIVCSSPIYTGASQTPTFVDWSYTGKAFIECFDSLAKLTRCIQLLASTDRGRNEIIGRRRAYAELDGWMTAGTP